MIKILWVQYLRQIILRLFFELSALCWHNGLKLNSNKIHRNIIDQWQLNFEAKVA